MFSKSYGKITFGHFKNVQFWKMDLKPESEKMEKTCLDHNALIFKKT
jgi:hypothetical protein